MRHNDSSISDIGGSCDWCGRDEHWTVLQSYITSDTDFDMEYHHLKCKNVMPDGDVCGQTKEVTQPLGNLRKYEPEYSRG